MYSLYYIETEFSYIELHEWLQSYYQEGSSKHLLLNNKPNKYLLLMDPLIASDILKLNLNQYNFIFKNYIIDLKTYPPYKPKNLIINKCPSTAKEELLNMINTLQQYEVIEDINIIKLVPYKSSTYFVNISSEDPKIILSIKIILNHMYWENNKKLIVNWTHK